MECIIRSLALDTRTPVASGVPKLYKGKINPPPCRLVVVVVGSPFHCVSRWVDMCLRELLDQMPSHAKNSNYMPLMLQSLYELDGNPFLLIEDATVMCLNINTK